MGHWKLGRIRIVAGGTFTKPRKKIWVEDKKNVSKDEINIRCRCKRSSSFRLIATEWKQCAACGEKVKI